ncbi:hypothetical protein SAMN05878482_10857 [Peribacillus simplex]|uniref:Uncharacterized protein n=1 Tax=Peribacillus simplex TaxID=1478 RepID=A0A9X8WMM8_9BACI|nr:hypothetical protein SAMN05878482_10857 [Peribacillus simplex]
MYAGENVIFSREQEVKKICKIGGWKNGDIRKNKL